MDKKNFYILLGRYRSGNCTEREKQLVQRWFDTLDEPYTQRTPEENLALEERIWKAVCEQEEPVVAKRAFSGSFWKWAAAAAIIALAALWSYPRLKQAYAPMELASDTTNLYIVGNSTAVSKRLYLPDSSEVLLSPQSRLSYVPAFNGVTREVHLEGKAFFKVRRNPDRPFLVHSGEITTKVLGTSFWVSGAPDLSAIEISVVSGRVSVSQKKQHTPGSPEKVKDGVILTANQKVRFSQLSHAFETGLVPDPKPVTGRDGPREKLVFAETPLPEVIRRLEKTYGIEFIVENEAMKGCLFTADITQESLHTQLDILCRSINANYEIRGTRVLISGKGCSFSN